MNLGISQLLVEALALSCISYAIRKVKSESCSVVSDSLQPHGLYRPWNSPGQNTGVGSCSLLQGGLPNLGMEPRSPALQADSLPGEPRNTGVGMQADSLPGEPRNTGVGSLSLLQPLEVGYLPSQSHIVCCDD